MIHAFALEPKLVASWGKREEFRFVHDKFGLGTPRVLLELPAFSKWKNDVYAAAGALDPALSEKDWSRLEEIFKLFAEHRCHRPSSSYDETLAWLENAEGEHARSEFRAIVATDNPRRHSAVVLAQDLGQAKAKLWACEIGATPSRSAAALTAALSPMLGNCTEMHLVDPHFNPEKARFRRVLEALLEVVAESNTSLRVVRVHCDAANLGLAFFEQEAAKMAGGLPNGITIAFSRWTKKQQGGEKLHNRYLLTNIGGVSFGVGLDEGEPSETDDVHLLTREQYRLRWEQYVGPSGAFDCADFPTSVRGTRPFSASARCR